MTLTLRDNQGGEITVELEHLPAKGSKIVGLPPDDRGKTEASVKEIEHVANGGTTVLIVDGFVAR